jgi:hypothetical protein
MPKPTVASLQAEVTALRIELEKFREGYQALAIRVAELEAGRRREPQPQPKPRTTPRPDEKKGRHFTKYEEARDYAISFWEKEGRSGLLRRDHNGWRVW